MIFQHLKSIRSTQSAESRQSKGVILLASDEIEWDGVGGFDVSLQAPHLEENSVEESGSGKFKRIMNICRVGSANRSSLHEQKSSRSNDDATQKISGRKPTSCDCDDHEQKSSRSNDDTTQKFSERKSTPCESDDLNNNVRLKVARYILTSMLSEEEETLGPYPRDKINCTSSDKNTTNAHYDSISCKSGTGCNECEKTVRRLHSYDDTVFDGIIEGILSQEISTNENTFIEAADRSEVPVVQTAGVVDDNKVKYWPNLELNMCFQNLMVGIRQPTPENHNVTWKHKVILSPLSY